MNSELWRTAQRLLALARSGLAYSPAPYDRERYEEIEQTALRLLEQEAGFPKEFLRAALPREEGYQTPKLDVRGALFRGEKVLLVRERSDGCWSLPGGWADVGYTPSQAVLKELREESGIEGEVVSLLALLDKSLHGHTPSLFYTYKAFFLCKELGGKLRPSSETLEAGFFPLQSLPPLSLQRVTPEELEMVFQRAALGLGAPSLFD